MDEMSQILKQTN